MKIIVAGTPVIGHLAPLMSIARMLIAHGHEVVGYTASAWREKFVSLGAGFVPFPSAIDRHLENLHETHPERLRLAPGPEQLLYDFKTFFIDPAPEQHRGLRDLLTSFPADLIIADVALFATLVMLLDRKADRPAIIHVGITALVAPRDDEAPFGPALPPATKAEELLAYRQVANEVNSALYAPANAHLNTKLAELGIARLEQPIFEAAVALPEAYLQLTVPSFEYPRRSMPSSVRFVGGLPLPQSNWPLPSWARDLDGSRKHVLVTQGTVANDDLGRLVGPVLSALGDRDDLLVIVTTGGRPLEAVPGPIPPNARMAEFIDYNWLMPRLDAMVTNGGYGTVNHALRHGLALVVAGKTEDKAEVAARVAWSGAGINLDTEQPTAAAVREAVDAVLGESQYRKRARSLASEFARYDTESEILRVVAEATGNQELRRRQEAMEGRYS